MAVVERGGKAPEARAEYLSHLTAEEVDSLVTNVFSSNSRIRVLQKSGLLEGHDRDKMQAGEDFLKMARTQPARLSDDLRRSGFLTQSDRFVEIHREHSLTELELLPAEVRSDTPAVATEKMLATALGAGRQQAHDVLYAVANLHYPDTIEPERTAALRKLFFEEDGATPRKNMIDDLSFTLEACQRYGRPFNEVLAAHKADDATGTLDNAHTAAQALEMKPVILWGEHRSSEPTPIEVMRRLAADPEILEVVDFREHMEYGASDYVSRLRVWRDSEGVGIDVPDHLAPLVLDAARKARVAGGGMISYGDGVRDVVLNQMTAEGADSGMAAEAFETAKRLRHSFTEWEQHNPAAPARDFTSALAHEKGSLVFNFHEGDSEQPHAAIWQSKDIRDQVLFNNLVGAAGARNGLLAYGSQRTSTEDSTVELIVSRSLHREPIPGVTDDPRIQAAALKESEITTVDEANPQYQMEVEQFTAFMKDAILGVYGNREQLLTDFTEPPKTQTRGGLARRG
ncbi:Uncharacterised protein [uncultured archaeon]|nr:Uncharacterised protein [uncultured archaeon]